MLQVQQDLQPYKLHDTLAEAQVTEGATVRVDAEGVYMAPIGEREPVGVQMVWCHTQRRKVAAILQPGTGGELSHKTSYDLSVPQAGWYNVTGLLVHTNGTMHVSQDAETKFELVAEPA